jgi:hypothetical protein
MSPVFLPGTVFLGCALSCLAGPIVKSRHLYFFAFVRPISVSQLAMSCGKAFTAARFDR